jgi:hypothetical protein
MKKLAITLLFIFSLTFLIGCKSNTEDQEGTKNEQPIFPAMLKGRVLSGSGDMLTAGIIITYPNGDKERVITNMLSGYILYLETGTYDLTFTRGIEYAEKTITVEVENYKTYYLDDVRLEHLYDGASKGWYLGQLHQHTTYSDGKQDVDQVLLSNLSSGLHYGYLTDHNTAAGLPEWMQGSRFVTQYDASGDPIYFVPMRGVEITTDYGHFQSLGMGIILEQFNINTEKGDIPIDEIAEIASEVSRSGALVTVNHPTASGELGFYFWDIIDLYDGIEIWNGLYVTNRNQNATAKAKWFELLEEYRAGNLPFIAATSGADNHTITGYYTAEYANRSNEEYAYEDDYLQRGRYSYMPSVAIHVDGELTTEAITHAIKNGHSYLTNGPRIIATIGDIGYGETYSLGGSSTVDIDFDLFSQDQIEQINIIKNGEVVKVITEGFDDLYHQFTTNLDDVAAGDWVVFEVIASNTAYAITNPIFFS